MSEAPSTPFEVVALLPSFPARFEEACAAVSRWARDGNVAALVALADAVADRDAGLADHVEDELTLTTGDGALEALLPRLSRSRASARSPEERLRAVASRLGATRPAEVFLAALDGEGPKELHACWMHELVVRGTALDGHARARAFQEELARKGHPLGVLSLALSDIEREVPSYVPLYGEQGLGRAYDALTSGPMSARTMPPPAHGASIRATELPKDERLHAAVAPWASPNGKIEARVFTLDPAVSEHSLGSWLVRALPLASTRDAKLACSRVGPDGAFGPLFAAAANGGARGAGLGGAYGRLAAWTSLSGLVGEEGSVDAIATAARRVGFMTFAAPGPWFHDVAWDLGVLALRPGGATVAVLAATDAE